MGMYCGITDVTSLDRLTVFSCNLLMLTRTADTAAFATLALGEEMKNSINSGMHTVVPS